MPESRNTRNRRLAIRIAILVALIVLGYSMYNIGKEYNVLLDNKTVTIDGIVYPMLDAVSLTVDGVKKNDVRADVRVAQKMVGKSHRIKLEVLNGDKSVAKTVERTVRFDLNMSAWMISLPALAAEATDIYVPSPVIFAPPPPPAATEVPAEAVPKLDGVTDEALPSLPGF
jgi:hypothetical protein